jgi:hypothetical protein
LAAGLAGWIGFLVLLVIAVLTVWDQVPPSPVPADAPPGQFSAERAQRKIEKFAAKPHPIGTAEHARVRDYLVDQLRSLGLDPHLHESTGIVDPGGSGTAGLIRAARVQNIVAVIKGTAPRGQILLTAHYDSVPTGPGANDDGVGVATILEVARALTQGSFAPRNDIVLLITDGEESGLLGAEAFVHDHRAGVDHAVVLNHEARGAGGPVIMFRAAPGAKALTRLYADVAPYPSGNSTTASLFKLIPNNTDFSVFHAAGFTGMDFAYVGRGAYYHSSLDSPSNVGRRSMQQMGDNTLALVRALVGADLTEYTVPTGDAVYFNVPPRLMVHFSAGWAWVLVVLAVLLVIGLVAFARIRRVVMLRQVVGGCVAVLFLVAAVVFAGSAYWAALKWIEPGFRRLLVDSPWEPRWLQIGAVVVGGLVLGVWYIVVRRLGVWALWLAALVLVTLLGVLGVALSPQLAPVLVPAPFAALGGWVALAAPKPVWRAVALTLGLVPAAVLILATGWMASDLGMGYGMYLSLPLIVLALLLMLPLVARPQIRWRRAAVFPAGAAVVVVVVSGLGVAANTPSAARPGRVELAYILDADSGRAAWVVPMTSEKSPALSSWASGYVGPAITDNPAPEPAAPRARVGPASPAALVPPQLRVVGDVTAGAIRTLKLVLTSPRGAEGIVLVADDPDGRVSRIAVEGRAVTPKAQNGMVGINVQGGRGPVEVELHFAAGGPLRVRLADFDRLPAALAGLPGYTPPPDDLYLGYSRRTVVASHLF